MSSVWNVLRRRILTPSPSTASLEKRGFNKKDTESQELLEGVGKTFLHGFAEAVESGEPDELEQRLADIEPRFRGFAFEGAGMGCAILDGLPIGRSDHLTRLLAGPGEKHAYMVHVGVGWAMARLPRIRWPEPQAFDTLLRWLVLDGYGFHQAYFHTRRYVHERHQPPELSWPMTSAYTGRAIDQGIGRAIWFVGGTDAGLVSSMIDKFPQHRKADLYSGAGLAATYAGGVDIAELRILADRAGTYLPNLAQASAFAAEARQRAGLDVVSTSTATTIFCGMSPAEAAELTRQLRPERPVDGDPPAYEIWRHRIADEFPVVGGVSR